ncbi:ribosomal protein S12 methylthiotransferase accessory factor [Streptomyces sp. CEV 2-1]|uniref:TOMM precursor leader peptide-binding protein n=1 Tax=Streptomyces sp. CEV 2-1 TaxID=2485153 RepID=UPI000F473E3C|nr:TOMM precursor leader peptide-binding protein [Streptomyces sp. CEV 2-1]ROQ65383.1 ribosomal protein S12 methylthiotransferase accessory factor [Streptomyces sp. CEV 2-1]
MTLESPLPQGPGPAVLPDGSALVGFRHHLRPATVPGEATYLVSRRGVTTLHGVLADVLVPLLDGTRSLNEILRAASSVLTTEEVEDGLARLSGAGLLRFCDPALAATGTDPVAEAYWDLAGLDGTRTAAGLAGSRLRVLPLNGVDAAPVLAASRESGLGLTAADADAELTLVLCDDYLSPELERVDAEHRATGKPWLLTRLCGYEPWIGPFFRPGEGACWSCLAHRVEQHRGYEEPLQRALGLDGPLARPFASLSAGRVMAAQSAVLEAAKWLAGLRYADQGAIRTVDTLTLSTRVHTVSRIPQCSSCGDPGLTRRRVLAPFVPVSRAKAGNGDHRALSPDQLLKRHAHLVSPVTGIVPVLEPSPGAPKFATTYVSGHNLAMRDRGPAGLRSQSGGKGLTDAEARTSALCEAVERYCGTRHGDEPVVVDTLRALGEQAIPPNVCQLYADQQFRERDRWNRSGSPFHYVPEPFDENRPVEWTPVWSLTERRQRLLPTSMLYFSAAPDAPGPYADSNGNAAGSSPEDALLQGFLELVERDAVALWWYNRTRRPAIDLDAFHEPYIGRLRDGYRKMGRDLWALDLTSDLGIPAMVAVSRRTEGPTEDIIFGFGAHFDPAVALRRALTEAGQLLPAVSTDRPGGGYGITDPLPVRWWRQATVANQPYLAPAPATRPRTPGHWNYVMRDDLLDDVEAIAELTAAKGLELLVLDQTRPDVALPVVKVIVPGLRHFWARYAPGRLFDAPVALGDLPRPTPYEELNPIPLFV